MVASLLRHHMYRYHGIFLTQSRGVDVRGGGSETYVVSLLQILKSVECPVEGCPARANNPGRLRYHFMYRHCKAKVAIIQEVLKPLMRYNQCGMYMHAARIFNQIQRDKYNKTT